MSQLVHNIHHSQADRGHLIVGAPGLEYAATLPQHSTQRVELAQQDGAFTHP
jgi:hypothetical protein